MAKSLFNQFAQIRGSRTYEDQLPLTVSGVQVAELAGHAKELNLYVDVSGTTVTRTSGEFEKRDAGNVILIGGSAYGITTASGTSCTVSSAPGDGSARPAALMYYQNLEDDLNYIRTMLKEITGLTNWYDSPSVALSELTFNFKELVDVFIGGGTYTANNMLYTVSSGVKDTNLMTFDPNTSMFTAANITTGGTLDVDGAADFDSSLNVQGGTILQSTLLVGSNVTVSGSFQFDATGQAVDTISTTVSVGSTNSELPTAAAVYSYVNSVAAGIDTFLELGDTFSFYTANNMLYETASGIADTNKMTYTPGTDTFAVSAAITNVTGAANFDSTMDVDGAVTLNSILDVDGAVEMHNTLAVDGDATFESNVVVSGSLKFDASGQTVDNIVTSISEPGADTNLATEQAIVEYVTAVSGVLFNQIEGIDTFIELEDTPDNYVNTKLVYSLASGIAYASELSYNGSNFNITVPTYISQDVRTDGDLVVGQTLTVTGTSTLINDVNIQGDLDVDTDLNVDGDSVVDGNSLVGGNLTVSGTFQFDAGGQTVNEISITMDPAGGDDTTLLTENAIFDFVNSVSGVLAQATADQTYLALTDTYTTSYTAGNMFYTTGNSGIMDTAAVTYAPPDLNGDTSFNVTLEAMSAIDATYNSSYENNTITIGSDDGYNNYLRLTDPKFGSSYPDYGRLEVQISRFVDPDYGYYQLDMGENERIVLQSSYLTGQSALNLEASNSPSSFMASYSSDSIHFYLDPAGESSTIGLGSPGAPVPSAATIINNTVISTTTISGIKLQSGARVNDITTVITEPGDDRTLATEQAIVEYVTAVSGVLAQQTSAQTYLALTDTESTGYTANNMLYMTSSGIMDTNKVKYNPLAETIYLAEKTRVDLYSADTFVIYNNAVDGNVINYTANTHAFILESNTITVQTKDNAIRMLVDDTAGSFVWSTPNTSMSLIGDQFSLAAGVGVNNISDTISGAGSDDNLVTEQAIVEYITAVSGALNNLIEAQDTFIELDDTPSAYTSSAYNLLRVNGTPDAVVFESNLTFSGSTFSITGDTDISGNADVGGTLDVDGIATFNNNVTVYGEFGFDTGETVTNISGAMTAPGDDDTLLTSKAIYDWVNTVSGSLQTDVLWEVVDTPTEQVRLKSDHITKAIWHGGNLTIAGDLTVSGTTTTINTNELTVEDKLITVNAGEAGAGITGDPLAGIEIDRGSESNYLFVFNETADNFRVGVSGSMTPGNTYTLQAVCTREDSPIDMRVPWWDADDYIYRNTGDTYISVNSGTHTLAVVADSDTKMEVAADNVKIYGDGNDYVEINSSGTPFFKVALDGNTELDVTSSGLALDNGARVDDITTVITEPGDDMTLATEKAIVDYVTQVSGVLQNNIDSFDTFIELTDTPDNYVNTKLVYSTGSDIQYATNLSYDGSGLIVSGTLNATGAVTFDSTLDVDGATTLNDTLDVDGATTLNSSITVSGAADFQSTVDIDGAATLNNTLDVDGIANFNSNVTVTGTLDVDGAVDFDSTLNVAGASTFQTTINVQGAADFDTTINVDGAATLNSTLKVNNVATFGNNVVVSGTFQFDAGGQAVNNIAIAMTPEGSDSNLLTEKAIWDYINTVSGAITTGSGTVEHNMLAGLQGGVDGEYYHLDQTDYTVLSAITSTQVSNWDTAYGWGNHAGLYDANGAASSAVSGHESTYDHDQIALNMANIATLSGAWITGSGILQDQIDLLEEIHADTEEPTGFVNRIDSAISNDDTNVTISGTSWDYYIKGVKYTVAGAKSMAIDGAFEGMQYFYMDTDSELHRMNSWSDDLITDYAYVAAVYWDDTNSDAIYMGDERHGVVMDAATHKYLHNTRGTAYISGLGITVVSGTAGDGSINGHAQIATTQGVIADEDVYHNIAALTGIANIPVFYKTGNSGLWRKTTANDFPVIPFSGGASRLAWNQFTSGTWQQTEVGKAQFVLAHIFATNDPTMQWIAVQGQATYDVVAAARIGATTEMNSLILAGLPFVEFVPVATLIYQTDQDYTNDINARIRATDEGADYVDWTKTKLSSVPGSVNDHGNLAGLADKDHPASAIFTDTTNFNGALSASDDTVQKALDTLDNAIAGIGHEHHDHDLTEVSTNVWEYAGDTGFSTVPTDLQVFVNGLKNRKTSDYYTAAISGGKITITFAYNVYTEDWINVTYTKADVA